MGGLEIQTRVNMEGKSLAGSRSGSWCTLIFMFIYWSAERFIVTFQSARFTIRVTVRQNRVSNQHHQGKRRVDALVTHRRTRGIQMTPEPRLNTFSRSIFAGFPPAAAAAAFAQSHRCLQVCFPSMLRIFTRMRPHTSYLRTDKKPVMSYGFSADGTRGQTENLTWRTEEIKAGCVIDEVGIRNS